MTIVAYCKTCEIILGWAQNNVSGTTRLCHFHEADETTEVGKHFKVLDGEEFKNDAAWLKAQYADRMV